MEGKAEETAQETVTPAVTEANTTRAEEKEFSFGPREYAVLLENNQLLKDIDKRLKRLHHMQVVKLIIYFILFGLPLIGALVVLPRLFSGLSSAVNPTAASSSTGIFGTASEVIDTYSKILDINAGTSGSADLNERIEANNDTVNQ